MPQIAPGAQFKGHVEAGSSRHLVQGITSNVCHFGLEYILAGMTYDSK